MLSKKEMENIVSNQPTTGTQITQVTAVSGSTDQIYRNTDNKMFFPKLLIAYNPQSTGGNEQELYLFDYDATDSEGDNTANKNVVPRIKVQPEETIILNEKDMLGWSFRYGLAGYVSNATDGLEVYVAGVEK